MRKNLMFSIILIITMLFVSLSGSLYGSSNNKNKVYMNESYIVKNNETKRDSELSFYGKNQGSTYRLYIDSSKDKTLPQINKPIDYILCKGNKDEWYEHLVACISINTTDYANNKVDFINNFGAVNTIYEYMFNFEILWIIEHTQMVKINYFQQGVILMF